MQFNTAILYDIENLIGGYNRPDMLSNLSLKDIYQEIQSRNLGKVAIQRAYANWSDPRLSILRGAVNELGIEPIQMFGFGRGPNRNASDIQLAIDAIDIAFTRKGIDRFVVVSGDGGFSALAKKLHEYGCMVVGCAYRRTTNRIFQAVCDDFIWIDEPVEENAPVQNESRTVPQQFSDPILIDFARARKPIMATGERVFQEAGGILNFLTENQHSARLLNTTGLNISIFSQAMAYRVRNLNLMALGFARLVDFLRFVTRQHSLHLIHNPPSEYRIASRNLQVSNFQSVSPLMECPEIHSYDTYRTLLGRGVPLIRVSNRDAHLQVVRRLAANPERFQNLPLGELIEALVDQVEAEPSDIKDTLLTLSSIGCFDRVPAEGSTAEQKFSYRGDSAEACHERLQAESRKKLLDILDTVDDTVLMDVIARV